MCYVRSSKRSVFISSVQLPMQYFRCTTPKSNANVHIIKSTHTTSYHESVSSVPPSATKPSLPISTRQSLPLTITQTIPPPHPPPKPRTPRPPPLTPQPRNRMKIRLRTPRILRQPRIAITRTIPALEIQGFGIVSEAAGYTISSTASFGGGWLPRARGCAGAPGGLCVGTEGALGIG